LEFPADSDEPEGSISTLDEEPRENPPPPYEENRQNMSQNGENRVPYEEEEEEEQEQDINPLNDQRFANWMQQITQAIARLANPPPPPNVPIPPPRTLNVVKVTDYHGYENEDPYDWLQATTLAATANNWDGAKTLQVACSAMKGPAAQWLQEMALLANPFGNSFDGGNPDFVTRFKEKFASQDRRNMWRIQLRALTQGILTVDAFGNKL